MIYKQTDHYFNGQINKYGCLFFSLLDIAEEHVGRVFTSAQIKAVYQELIATGAMREDCYVLDHAAVIATGCQSLGLFAPVRYVGAHYNNEITDRKSWGVKHGHEMILQYLTPKGNTHFRRPHYDPYQPPIGFTNLMSVRWYNVGSLS
jgi:hypothetical protein